jgi:hypothetical protein
VRNRWLLVTIALGCLVLAVGCGGTSDEPETQSAPQPTATPGPSEVPFAMDGVVWASAIDEDTGEPVDEVDAYTTVSDRIVAVVPASNVLTGTEFTATWTIDGIDVPEATMSVTVEQDLVTAWIAFEFVRDEGRYFPLGELEVTVTASTGDEVTGSVDIELP